MPALLPSLLGILVGWWWGGGGGGVTKTYLVDAQWKRSCGAILVCTRQIKELDGGQLKMRADDGRTSDNGQEVVTLTHPESSRPESSAHMMF